MPWEQGESPRKREAGLLARLPRGLCLAQRAKAVD